jgi:hypothetical protein
MAVILHRCLFQIQVALVGLAVVIFMAIFPGIAGAQGSKVGAALEGTVRDASGAVISAATVVLRNLSTNQTRSAQTDAEGSFHAEAIAVGAYEVRVDQTGFAPYQLAEVDLTLGQTTNLDIVLAPAGYTEKITVSAPEQAFDVSQTSIVSSVDRERIE